MIRGPLEPDRPGRIDWQARALSHATVVRALLSVKDLPPDSAGAAWLAEANQTLKLGGVRPGVGVGPQ